MLLIGIGFLAGIVTAISPCVLPVLPILLAGGASGRKPFRIIAGLVLSFSVFTLFASWLLDKLGLPQDLLRNLAIALLFVMAAVLLVPGLALWLERSLAFFSRLRPANAGGGFFLGVTLGLVFVPCAGPFLAAVTTAAARENFGVRTIAATVAYSVGAAIPMLADRARRPRGGGAHQGARRDAARGVRRRGRRRCARARLPRRRPPREVDARVHDASCRTRSRTAPRRRASSRRSAAARRRSRPCRRRPERLPDYGVAPPIKPDGDWINTKPLVLSQLRGKVVLIDFWTYSCINCLRTLPHLKAWYATYHKDGLRDHRRAHAGVRVRARLVERARAVKRLGITYPVVQDNRFKTWDAYANQYWPAEYLIDKTGHIRHTNFGEGEYGETESLIRQLLGAKGAKARQVADATPTGLLTPETYLGYARLTNYVGTSVSPDIEANYRLPVERAAEHVRLRRPVARRRARGRRRQGRDAAAALPREERLHRPRRARHRPRASSTASRGERCT